LALLDAYRRRFWAGVDIEAVLRGTVPYAVPEPVTATAVDPRAS
jgi:hypothetical protein